MVSTRIKLLAVAAAGVLGTAGYLVYSAFAAQGQGALAQAPLNVQVQVPPSLIMALDDSGSMLWETLNNTRDGVYVWRNQAQSFFNGNTPYGYNDSSYRFYYTFPPYGRGQQAIPPLDAFGFARSPDVNPGYFDPRVEYAPWKKADGGDYLEIDPESAPLDPRPAGSVGKINGSLNLTTDVEPDGSNWHFRVPRHAIIPEDTVVKGYCSANPNIRHDDFEPLDRTKKITEDNCNLYFRFFPATFFLEDTSSLPAEYGYSASPLPVTDPEGGRPGTLYKYEIRRGNFSSDAAYEAAIQNFANWFSFYRTRREALIGGATNALADATNLRVGWFRINNRNNVTMRDMSSNAEKESLFEDIYKLRATGNTPTRRAVQHLGEQFKRSGSGAPVALSCQRNAGMLFTDGYINDSESPNNIGNLDGGLGAPFADAVDNTVADIVVPFYQQSLRPDIEKNAVPVPSGCSAQNPDPRLDCQKNLHMNFYAVTLGTLGEKYGVSYVPDPDEPWKVVPDPFDAPPSWASSRLDLHPRAVDELWHATLNSRGEMINATRPADITAALRRILISVAAGASPSGSIALTGARIGTASLSVEPFYEARNEGTDWYGRLTGYALSMENGRVVPEQAWEVTEQMPSHGSRRIWFGSSSGVKSFDAGNLDWADLCSNLGGNMSRCYPHEDYFGSGGSRLDVTLADAVSYLRGNTSLETRLGGVLRDRGTVLGDIVNSAPVVSAPTDDYGYRALPDSTLSNSYATYLQSKRSQRNVMVYVGANDGMLHAFDAGMGADGVLDGAGGVEKFAYIPQAVLGHMGNLLFPYDPSDGNDQHFQHRYYVDGPIAISDAYYSGSWSTVLVGTTGAGGRGVFALDVSDASSEAPFSAQSRLWEINHLDESLHAGVRSRIGHVLGRPVVVPVKDAAGNVTFKAIFGNGYSSSSGKAVLFVVDIGTGNPSVRMIEAVESGAPAGNNGLGNIVVLDRWGGAELADNVRDGYADTVYAADQKGAIWKFDLRSDLPASANGVSTVTSPLFVTQSREVDGEEVRQPILGGLAAAASPTGGVMLYFGTGSFSFEQDVSDNSMQTLYGIVDNGSADTFDHTSLVQQTVGTADASGARQVSANLQGPVHRGWFLNLPAGERMVGYPRLESGIVFMPTYSPSEQSGCSTSGFNSLFGLSALTGGAALSHVRAGAPDGESPPSGTGSIQLETGGTAPVKDIAVMSTPRLPPLAGGSTAAELEAALAAECSMVVQVAGAPPLYLPRACGRQSWRQLH